MKVSLRQLHAASALMVSGAAALVLLVAMIGWSTNLYRQLSQLGDLSSRLPDLEGRETRLAAENENLRRKIEPIIGPFFIYEHGEIARRILPTVVARATGAGRFRPATLPVSVEATPSAGSAVQLRAPMNAHANVDQLLNNLSNTNIPGVRIGDFRLSATDPIGGQAQGTLSIALTRFAATGGSTGTPRHQ